MIAISNLYESQNLYTEFEKLKATKNLNLINSHRI
jgi:hypothetical protein